MASKSSSASKGGAKAPLTKVQALLVKKVVEDEALTDQQRVRELREKLVEALQHGNSLEAALSGTLARVDLVKGELERTTKVKDTLESLCRELKKQNSAILSASERASKAEEEHRATTSAKFQAAIDEVNRKIEAQGQVERTALELQHQLAEMNERIRVSEEYHSKQLEAKEIEIKLANAKGEQEVQRLSHKLREAELRAELVEKLAAENESLRSTVGSYEEQFNKIKDTMTRSSAMYETLHKDMAVLNKHKASVEAENKTLHERCTSLSAKLKETVKAFQATQTKQTKQIDSLKALCRKLMADPKSGGVEVSNAASEPACASSQAAAPEASKESVEAAPEPALEASKGAQEASSSN